MKLLAGYTGIKKMKEKTKPSSLIVDCFSNQRKKFLQILPVIIRNGSVIADTNALPDLGST